VKIGFLGDSITQGVGASAPEFNYVSQVKKTLDCEVVNYGISGTRIARQKVPTPSHAMDIDFNLRVPLLDRSLDKIFVFGGTNDYGHGKAPFGKVGDNDEYTFHGAVNKLFSTLIEIYGKEKIVVLFPLRRVNCETTVSGNTGLYLVEYVKVIKHYVDFYGLKYIDFYNDGLAEPPMGASEYFSDGLHPNDKGHKFLAEKICEFIKNDK
jgi:lysophospholipase L1-like esterase